LNRARLRRLWLWIGLGGALVVILAFIRVEITDPRVHIRWRDDVDAAARPAREQEYDLRNGQPVAGTTSTWRYGLGDLSRENIRALVGDPAVADTAYLDRDALTSDGRSIRVTVWYPFNDLLDGPSQLFQLHPTLWLLLGGGMLLVSARASSAAIRRNTAVAVLLVVGLAAVASPYDPSFVTMGGSSDHVRSRDDFEDWFAGRVRYEKHLSQVILLQVYLRLEPTDAAPGQALLVMSRFATAWFVLSAFAIGVLERWSALVLRYLGLVLLAPSALLYFGWRELGYLSLNCATFPLLVRGVGSGGMRLEAASALAGLGAALHASGLVSLAGAWMAALGARGRLQERAARALRVAAWGTAAYLGWLAIYAIVLKLPIVPDPQPSTLSPWRPWFADEVREGRVAVAILSPTGARDLLMTAWIVGAPLLIVALSLWRRCAHEVRAMLWYLPPSVLFVIFRWPFEGIGGGMDLVLAGFPAVYALAWVSAHDAKRTTTAAALLMAAHYAFWRVVFDDRFEPPDP
jgi:hypothetical protein